MIGFTELILGCIFFSVRELVDKHEWHVLDDRYDKVSFVVIRKTVRREGDLHWNVQGDTRDGIETAESVFEE